MIAGAPRLSATGPSPGMAPIACTARREKPVRRPRIPPRDASRDQALSGMSGLAAGNRPLAQHVRRVGLDAGQAGILGLVTRHPIGPQAWYTERPSPDDAA